MAVCTSTFVMESPSLSEYTITGVKPPFMQFYTNTSLRFEKSTTNSYVFYYSQGSYTTQLAFLEDMNSKLNPLGYYVNFTSDTNCLRIRADFYFTIFSTDASRPGFVQTNNASGDLLTSISTLKPLSSFSKSLVFDPPAFISGHNVYLKLANAVCTRANTSYQVYIKNLPQRRGDRDQYIGNVLSVKNNASILTHIPGGLQTLDFVIEGKRLPSVIYTETVSQFGNAIQRATTLSAPSYYSKTGSWGSGVTSITLSDVTGLRVTDKITGTGIPTSTAISAINTSTNTITINKTTTASGSNPEFFTRIVSVANPANIEIGMSAVSGSVPANTTVSAVNGNEITLNNWTIRTNSDLWLITFRPNWIYLNDITGVVPGMLVTAIPSTSNLPNPTTVTRIESANKKVVISNYVSNEVLNRTFVFTLLKTIDTRSILPATTFALTLEFSFPKK